MDTKALIKKLQEIFLEFNKGEKRYTKIWLSEIDLGGLYYSDKFILRLKAAYNVADFVNETIEVITMLKEKAKEESRYIQRVSVYDVKETAQPKHDDIIIYEEASAFA